MEGMELDKLSNLKEEPHLSGAYIRSLVKQLSSSRTKDPMSPKDQDSAVDRVNSPGKHTEALSESKPLQQTTQPQQHKKQVRRRLHTCRPYQERLLNMAEARREIVTALKYHRAAMKQASEDRQKQSQDQQQPLSHPMQAHQPYFDQDGRIKSGRNLRIYPSNTTDLSNHMDCYSLSSFPQPPTSVTNPFWWSGASSIAPPLHPENPNFVLPNQTLGLNLNLHDFNNLEATPYHNSSSASWPSAWSPSSSSSPPLSIATDQEVPLGAISQGEGSPSPALMDTSLGTSGLHAAMCDEEIAEIRSIGEQYQMEWNDTMNLVTSARWFKFLKTMELGAPEVNAEDDSFDVFEVMEFPSWLNASDSFLERCSEEYSQDPALPCLDIGDIEGMDGDWWA